jgi:argininosuccinate synthase
MNRIVLAYSGGVTSSLAIPWLAARHDAELIAVTVDVGQGDLEPVRARALAAGAARAHILDAREEFAREFVVRVLQADAWRGYVQMPALAAPFIAKKVTEIAAIEQATAIAHGARSGTDRPSTLDRAFETLNPGLPVLTPGRHIPGSEQPVSPNRDASVEANLWGRCVEYRGSDRAAAEKLFCLTKPLTECPSEPAYVELSFERGAPISVNGIAMPLTELIASLTTIAGAHGVGRGESIAGSPDALTILSEAPAATLLHLAHRELQQSTVSDALDSFCEQVADAYVALIDSGNWFTTLREALDAFVANVQERVTGVVRLKLFKGACEPVARTSPNALTNELKTANDPIVVA